MTETSARFALPLLQPGQAQKEVFHNEALTLIDAALHPVALAIGIDDPPASPDAGQAWIVGGAPTGAWAGCANALAIWTMGGWRFVTPMPGMSIWLAADRLWALYDGSGWISGILPVSAIHVGGEQVLGARQPAIADPAGGATIDAEARSAVASLLAALRNHGILDT